jgi:hypothetical protein
VIALSISVRRSSASWKIQPLFESTIAGLANASAQQGNFRELPFMEKVR